MEENQKKKKKVSTIIMIIIAIIILITIPIIMTVHFVAKKANNNTINESVEETKTEKKSQDKIQEEIDNIIGKPTRQTILNLDPLTGNGKKLEELTDMDKINSILTYKILQSYYPDLPATVKIEWEVEYDGEIHTVKDSASFMDKKELADLYKKIYQQDLPAFDPNQTRLGDTACPTYAKEDETYYYFHHRCGGSSVPNINKTYIYKYSGDENTLTIYYALSYSRFLNTDENHNNHFAIYTDEERENLYLEDVTSFEINDENYKDFTQYKIIFEKQPDGNYLFKESVKIK